MDLFERADRVEAIVMRRYGDPQCEASSLALREIDLNPNRSDEEIASAVAGTLKEQGCL